MFQSFFIVAILLGEGFCCSVKANFYCFTLKKVSYLFADLWKMSTFATANAEIAQLVEHNLAKVGVASSSLVFRSNENALCACSLK